MPVLYTMMVTGIASAVVKPSLPRRAPRDHPGTNPKFITGESKALNTRKLTKKTCQKFGYW
jgi:hypothetical protein